MEILWANPAKHPLSKSSRENPNRPKNEKWQKTRNESRTWSRLAVCEILKKSKSGWVFSPFWSIETKLKRRVDPYKSHGKKGEKEEARKKITKILPRKKYQPKLPLLNCSGARKVSARWSPRYHALPVKCFKKTISTLSMPCEFNDFLILFPLKVPNMQQ